MCKVIYSTRRDKTRKEHICSYCQKMIPVVGSVLEHTTLTQSYKQFGNSVAVNVLKAIIRRIFNPVVKESRTTEQKEE